MSEIAAEREKKISQEKKVVLEMCNEELEKINARIDTINREVPKIFMNGGSRGKAKSQTVELAKKILSRAAK